MSDAQWQFIAPLMLTSSGKAWRPFNDHRLTTEGIIYRYRAGIPWRDLPPHLGAWQSVWKRHRRYSLDGTWDQVLAALLTRSDAAGLINWEVSIVSAVNRAHQHGRNLPRHTEDLSNYKNLLDEPVDHAVGKSRSGLTTKIHALVDGYKRSLVLLLGPDRAMTDKACSSKRIRSYLRSHGIQLVIPEKEDQKANRQRKGSAGGRPVTYDREAYKRRNVVERSFNTLKQWRGLATRYDKLAKTY